MPTGTSRASTQDNSAGVQYATTPNEDGGQPFQAVATVTGKTLYARTAHRTGIAAADTPGDMTSAGFGASRLSVYNAGSIHVEATSSVASAILVGQLAFYDESGNFAGFSQQVVFTSDAANRLGSGTGNFVCPAAILNLGASLAVRFFILSISAGTWAINVRPFN
jgi:hypothetical protein